MKNRYFKYGGVVIAIGIAFFVYRAVSDQLMFDKLDQGGKNPTSKRQYIAYVEDLNERYKNDNYGSTTPEGTLALFVEALKGEDVVLASNYFVPEKRKQMEEELQAGLESGGVTTLIEISKKDMKGSYLDEVRYELDTFNKNNESEYSFIFILNKYTQKWLIESL